MSCVPARLPASAYMMQTLGLAAVAEKSLILVDASGVQILEVSSGLDAIVTLLALTCAVVFIRSSPLWQKIVIVPSAVPIALALNILRVTLAAVLYKVFGNWRRMCFSTTWPAGQ